MTNEERNYVLDEAADVVRKTHVNNGDHLASLYSPSPDAEILAKAVESLKKSHGKTK